MGKRHHYGPDGEYQGYDSDEGPSGWGCLGWIIFWFIVFAVLSN